MKSQGTLLEFYREIGEEPKARELEELLRARLAVTDSNHPLLAILDG